VLSTRSYWIVLVAVTVTLAASAAGSAANDWPEDQLRHNGVRSASVASALQSVASPNACGDITADTVMTEELLECHSGQIMRITGNAITVDLNGLVFSGGIVLIEGNAVTLRNGTVDAPGVTIAIFVAGSDALLENLTVQNAFVWAVEAGNRTTVRDSLFRGNMGVSVDQYYGSNLVVENTTFVDNGVGVSIQSGRDAVIENNHFEGNGAGVNVWDEDMILARDTIVRDNTFDGNVVGVRVHGILDASGTVIERNVIRDSATSGILVTSEHGRSEGPPGFFWPGGAADTVIRGNVIQRSGEQPTNITVCKYGGYDPTPCATTSADDGITVLAADPVVLPSIVVEGNRSLHNAGHGIEAADVTDGGKNVAARNGAGDCIGVRCRGG
jgi:hypothetical protein